MLHFDSDYICGAHPKVLEALIQTNLDLTPGYGEDIYCAAAKEKIRRHCGVPDADVFFLVGGTQANAIAAAAVLPPYAGVCAADTGHIAVHEAGAVEATGHKVITLKNQMGKITPESLETFLSSYHADSAKDHMVYPGMVYISQPTECGTVYTAGELAALKEICLRYEIPLYIDGARLGYALTAKGADMALPFIAKVADLFYIGGTKAGALFGEAMVSPQKGRLKHFISTVKRHGGLLAKGRLLGVQFNALFTDSLYFDIARHANEMAERLKAGFVSKGYTMMYGSPTNLRFVLLENAFAEKLRQQASFENWEVYDKDHTVFRFVTGFSTTKEDIEKLISFL